MINLQDYILEQLSKPGNFKNAFGNNAGTALPVVVPPSSVNGWIDVPMTQSQFAVICDIPGHNTKPLFLKKFTWPEAGIEYSMDEEKMWFPIPTVGVKAITMEGYLFSSDVSSLYYLYNKQFENGLLSMNKQPTFVIVKFIPHEEFDAKLPLAAMGAVMKGILAGAAGQDGLAALASMAIDAEDVVSDVKLQAANFEYMAQLASVTNMVELRRCKISKPTITMSQESNDFATVSIQVSYSDVSYCEGIDHKG